MSAWIVSKTHVDLMVRAALRMDAREPLQWWEVDDAGAFASWRKVDEFAESHGDEEQARRGLVSPSQLGQILVSENVRSVGLRYSEEGRTAYYGAEVAASMDDLDADSGELPGPLDAYYMGPYVYADPGYIEVFKTVHCFRYQACETDDWEASEAFRICAALTDMAAHRIEGYDETPWGWDQSDLEGRSLSFARRII